MRFLDDIPALPHIGADLLYNIHHCEETFKNGAHSDGTLYFSPLFVLVFAFLSQFSPLFLRCACCSLTLASYLIVCLVFPRFWGKGYQISPAGLVIMCTGFMSYGLRFDLERGQWNAIMLMLSLAALLLSHSNLRSVRVFAYGLFSLAVHLKLWPIIFSIGFINPSEGCWRNVRRFLLLAIANGALLMILGPRFFVAYLSALTKRAGDPYLWVGNHSLWSFSQQVERAHDFQPAVLQLACAAFVLLYLMTICVAFYRRWKGDDILIVLLCMLGGMLFPTTSHDYKLLALSMTMAVFVSCYRIEFSCMSIRGCTERIVLSIMLLCYSVTMYSYVYRMNWDIMLKMNTMFLVCMVLSVMALIWIRGRQLLTVS